MTQHARSFQEWLSASPSVRYAPLFDAASALSSSHSTSSSWRG